jgi:hypothetical protein
LRLSDLLARRRNVRSLACHPVARSRSCERRVAGSTGLEL